MYSSNFLVSVIIPVYNVEQYLPQCVESVINQTYTNLQIILVNDGSTDKSGEICDKFAEIDNRICVIHKENGGSSSSRKAGMNAISGQYVMFLDSDDWLDLCAIEKCIKEINNDLDIGCVMFSYVKERGAASIPMHVMQNSQRFVGEEAKDKVHRRIFGLVGDELAHPERMENVVTCWMKLYRADYAKQGRYYDTKVVGTCEDGLFNIFALENCEKISYIDEPLYHYRKHKGSLVSSYKPNLINQWNTLFSIMQEYIFCNQLGKRYSEALDNRIALSITAITLNKISDTNSSFFNKIKYIKNYISSKQYHNAVKKLDIRYLPYTWKVLLLCSKMKFATAVYLGMYLVKIILLKGK